MHLHCVKVHNERHGMQGGNCNPDPNQRRVTVMISDVCQPCSPPGDDHIDLQALTFLKVMPSLQLTSLKTGSVQAACWLPARHCAMSSLSQIRCGCML